MTTAVELLRKGGTLVSESCSFCSGVQVKFSGKTICVNCGKEETVGIMNTGKVETEGRIGIDLKNIIFLKIGDLLPLLKSEKDLSKQADITRLIKQYLDILEKLRDYKES